MSKPETVTDETRTPAPGDGRTVVQWWVAALTGLGGLAVGIIIAAVLLGTTPQFGTAVAGSPEGEQPAPGGDVPVVVEARVNAACLRVINEAQDVVRILSGVDEAAADVDLLQMDDIVRRLQPVEARLQRDLQQCRVDTSTPSDPSAAPSASVPTMPQPTSTPR